MVNEGRQEGLRRELLDWSYGNLRKFPWRNNTTPYEILVAEILLSATLASKVEPVYKEILEKYPDFQALSGADVDKLASIIQPLGLQNRRARALVDLGEQLSGQPVPESIDELRELPWVDHYVANAVRCFGAGERRPIVDTNVVRVYNRVFDEDFTGSEDKTAWSFAWEMLPEDEFQRFNLALLDLGAEICTSSNPDCEECPLAEFCNYYQLKQ
jgi:A/G-specific adenine glycosylase